MIVKKLASIFFYDSYILGDFSTRQYEKEKARILSFGK